MGMILMGRWWVFVYVGWCIGILRLVRRILWRKEFVVIFCVMLSLEIRCKLLDCWGRFCFCLRRILKLFILWWLLVLVLCFIGFICGECLWRRLGLNLMVWCGFLWGWLIWIVFCIMMNFLFIWRSIWRIFVMILCWVGSRRILRVESCMFRIRWRSIVRSCLICWIKVYIFIFVGWGGWCLVFKICWRGLWSWGVRVGMWSWLFWRRISSGMWRCIE